MTRYPSDVATRGLCFVLAGLALTDRSSVCAPAAPAQVWESEPVLASFHAPGVGFVVENAHDVDGDGLDDVLVTDIGAAAGRGRLYVISSTGPLLHSFTGVLSGDNLGDSCAGVGDVDGDGAADVVVGSPVLSGVRPGLARVYSGASGDELWSVAGESVGDRFGWVVASAGDVDGDDLLLCSGQTNSGGQAAGAVYLFSGASGESLGQFTGDTAGLRMGTDCAGLGDVTGDVTGDGVPDVLAGVGSDAAGLGGVFILSGNPLPPHPFCASRPNSSGEQAQLGYRHSLSLSRAELALLVSQAVPEQAGLFFGGSNPVGLPFGDGVRCVGEPLLRLGAVAADAQGEAQLSPSWGAGGSVLVGLPWHVQFCFRDPLGAGAGWNLSDGLLFTIRA